MGGDTLCTGCARREMLVVVKGFGRVGSEGTGWIKTGAGDKAMFGRGGINVEPAWQQSEHESVFL